MNGKLTKLTKALQMPSQDAGQEMVKGKHNRNPRKFMLKDYMKQSTVQEFLLEF